jgi:hypothetical protein
VIPITKANIKYFLFNRLPCFLHSFYINICNKKSLSGLHRLNLEKFKQNSKLIQKPPHLIYSYLSVSDCCFFKVVFIFNFDSNKKPNNQILNMETIINSLLIIIFNSIQSPDCLVFVLYLQ